MTRLFIALFAAVAALAPTLALANPLDVLGSADPATPDLNAMAVGLDGFAYLGSWGSTAECEGLGARVFDARDPTAPVQLSAPAAAYPGTTAEHLAVVHYASSTFTGNVLFAGIQRCRDSATGGLAIWDVSDPGNPSELSFLPTGRGPVGVHELTVRQSGDHWYGYLAAPFSETTSGQGDLRSEEQTSDFQPH